MGSAPCSCTRGLRQRASFGPSTVASVSTSVGSLISFPPANAIDTGPMAVWSYWTAVADAQCARAAVGFGGCGDPAVGDAGVLNAETRGR